VGLPGVGANYEEPEFPDVVATGGEEVGAVEAIVARATATESLRMTGAAPLP
jgi:hypothetical protein